MLDFTSSRRVLIFGGTGSLGKALIKRLADANTVAVYSRDEAKHWTIRNQMPTKRVTFMVGDVRDYERCKEAILSFRPNVVIIASALKQVDTCERSPDESIKTNVIGVQNIVKAVVDNYVYLGAISVLLVSTDKACEPVNVYGMCKALAEKIVTNELPQQHATPHMFMCVRYGNVLESRGSIVPLFRHQAEFGEAFTITHSDMTRFLMTLDESVDLIVTAINHGLNGETWVPQLPSMKLQDLAEIFSETYNKPIKTIGVRPGEKLHELLVGNSESCRTYKKTAPGHEDSPTRGKEFWIIKPSSSTLAFDQQMFTNSSQFNTLSKKELLEKLTKLDVIKCDLSKFVGRSIEEIDA